MPKGSCFSRRGKRFWSPDGLSRRAIVEGRSTVMLKRPIGASFEPGQTIGFAQACFRRYSRKRANAGVRAKVFHMLQWIGPRPRGKHPRSGHGRHPASSEIETELKLATPASDLDKL